VWQRAAAAARQTGHRHVRNISSEMNKVVTKPISNSISNSFSRMNGVAGWYEYWLADGSGITQYGGQYRPGVADMQHIQRRIKRCIKCA
jgi:hypothetical protein